MSNYRDVKITYTLRKERTIRVWKTDESKAIEKAKREAKHDGGYGDLLEVLDVQALSVTDPGEWWKSSRS